MAQVQKLLEGLNQTGDGITVRSIADFTAGNGIYVSLHCSRHRGRIPLPSQLVGVQKMKDEAKAAYANYISLGSLNFIPAEDEAKISGIESAIRWKVDRRTITNGFMSISKYEGLKNEFLMAREEYFQERDRLIANWDDLVKNFISAVDAILAASKLLKRDKINLRKELLSNIPTKERYAASYGMTLDVRTFPSVPNLNMIPQELGEDVINSWKEVVLNNAVDCISALTQDVFDLCSCVAASYADRGDINGHRMNSLVAMGTKIKENNLFRNPMLANASEQLLRIQNLSENSVDEIEEIVEDVLITLYQYCQETGVTLKLPKKGLPKEVLENMVALRTNQTQIA